MTGASWSNCHLRRILDLLTALVLVLMALPIMLLTIILIRVVTPKYPLVFSVRVLGRNQQPFRMMKFSTMAPDAPDRIADILGQDAKAAQEWETHGKLTNDPRIETGFARFMRRHSIDELPQLFHVMAGQMSLVGPRPIAKYEVDKYKDEGGRSFLIYRQSVRPGITGPCQILDRHRLSYADRWHVEAEYLTNVSPAMDLLILLRTIPVVIVGTGS